MEMKGVLMALVIMGFSFAILISGSLGQLVARVQELSSQGGGLWIYSKLQRIKAIKMLTL